MDSIKRQSNNEKLQGNIWNIKLVRPITVIK